jgi:DNA-binding transcriptional MerR regulator
MYGLDAETAALNIKAVAQETGLKPVTIRAWERRYGLPQPGRTAGGDRRYGARDVALLKWLVARQAEGVAISQAVALWRSLEQQGRDPLGQDQTAAVPAAGSGAQPVPQLDELRQRWIDSCLAFDQAAAEQVLGRAFALFPAETVCHEVLRRGLAEIGAGWYHGAITIQQEHFASVLTLRRVEMLVASLPPPTRQERFLIACAPGDTHTLAPLLLTYVLGLRGWPVIYLGPNVPTQAMESTIEQVQPELVILSAQQLHTAAALQESATVISQHNVPVAYGGYVFNNNQLLRERIPGRYLGADIETIPQAVESLLQSRPPTLVVPPADPNHQQSLQLFTERRSLLEAHIWGRFIGDNQPTRHLTSVNNDLAQTIQAALSLGDIRLLPVERSWYEHLLMGYRLAPDWLGLYFESYQEAIRIHLSATGSLLVNWSAELLPSDQPAGDV